MFIATKNINPHFYKVWNTDKAYNVLKGGRNSFKSSVIVLKLAFDMYNMISKGDKCNVVIIRKVANTIRDSVYNKIQWALSTLGVLEEFKCTVSPFKVQHESTGSSFYFYGADDFQKLKSNDINNIIAVWYEEAAEFDSQEEFDQTNITFMRQKHINVEHVKFYWSYNPPRNPYNWINEWVEDIKHDENYLVHESSYLDDRLGFVTEQMLDDINRIKETDFDYYRYIYLGEPVGLGTNVYDINTFNKIDSLPSNDKLLGISFALDTGHQQSATACGAYAVTVKGNVILLDTFYYSPAGKAVKAAPSELTVMIHEFTEAVIEKYKAPVLRRTIDSAEGALRNQYYHDYGIRWNPVAKKKNQTMIDMVVSLLASGRFHYLDNENNKIFVHEHKIYRYDEKTLNTPEPKVIKEDDHCCDFMKYFVLDNAKLLNLA